MAKNRDKKNTTKKESETSRRDFLKKGLIAGAGVIAGGAVLSRVTSDGNTETGETIKMLSADGKLVEVDSGSIKETTPPHIDRKEATKGIPGRKFVMVIDLSKCKNARKCVEKCQSGHHLPHSQEWIPIFLLKDSDNGSLYWFPRPCYHCDNPSCVKVCPVGATYKRSDGIVLIDNKRCIGCKFCMSACPYSARTFNWQHHDEHKLDVEYSPETSIPSEVGIVGKCDFCPDKSRVGELPYCADGCPMGAIYFGDENEDTVTNGDETVRFSEIMRDKAGYQYLEHLGTQPRVYYLPPVNRQFPIERGFEGLPEDIAKRYEKIYNPDNKD